MTVDWKIGDTVRCIHSHHMSEEHVKMWNLGVKFPDRDQLYTIRGFNGFDGIWLNEIISPKCTHNGDELGFHFWFFEKTSPEYSIY